VDGKIWYLTFDSPHIGRNIVKALKTRTLSLWPGGPTIGSSHLIEALLYTQDRDTKLTWRCFAEGSERQHTDAAFKILCGETADFIKNIIGVRAGGTALFIAALSPILELFVGSKGPRCAIPDLPSVVAGLIFLRTWAELASRDLRISNEAECGLEVLGAIVLTQNYSADLSPSLSKMNTLRLEGFFSFVRGGTAKVAATGSDVTAEDILIRSRQYHAQTKASLRLEEICGVPPPSKKAKLSISSKNTNNANITNASQPHGTLLIAAPAEQLYCQAQAILEQWARRYLPLQDCDYFISKIPPIPETSSSESSTPSQLTWKQLVAAAAGMTDEGGYLDDDDAGESSDNDDAADDEFSSAAGEFWSFLGPEPQLLPAVIATANLNTQRAALKVPLTAEPRGKRNLRFATPANVVPSAKRCRCASRIAIERKVCPCVDTEDLATLHSSLAKSHFAVGATITNPSGLVEVIDGIRLGKGVLPCATTLLQNTEVMVQLFSNSGRRTAPLSSLSGSKILCPKTTIPALWDTNCIEFPCKCKRKQDNAANSSPIDVVSHFVDHKNEFIAAKALKLLCFKVVWKGFGEDQATWEYEDHLRKTIPDATFRELIEDYTKLRSQRDGKRVRLKIFYDT